MTLQRYKSNGHYSDGPCDNGEWVKASEAEAEIAKGERLLVLAIEKRDMEILSLEAEIARLRKALEVANSYIRELQDDNAECGYCCKESLCFTCGMLLSACDTIKKALEDGK